MNIKFIEYDGISGYARVMYHDVEESDKYQIEVTYNGKDIKALLEYLFDTEYEVKRLNNIINDFEEDVENRLMSIPDDMCDDALEEIKRTTKIAVYQVVLGKLQELKGSDSNE